MKPKFEIDQTIWYERWADTFMCWKPVKDTITKIEMMNGVIFYTAANYDNVQIKEDSLYDNYEDCRKACIARMQDNIKYIQEHIDALTK